MKHKFTLTALALIVVIIFQSCTGPQNIIKLQPEEEGGKWLYGQNFVSDSLYGVIFEVGFDKFQDNEYWFDFNIINRSNMPVLIDPAKFKCQAYDTEQQALSSKKLKAVDPEKEIFELEKDLSKNEARQKNSIGLSIMAAGIDIATGIATATDDNPHNDHFRTHIFEGVLIDNADTKFEAESISDLLHTWKSSTIRKTTLETNYSMQGKVFLPANPDAAYFKLFLPVDDEFVQFNFVQVQFPVQ